MKTEKCYKCEKCGNHWSGEYGMNNAIECCKLTEWKVILKKREYWEGDKCDDCGKIMVKDGKVL